jgi:hypothetical protein
MSVAIGMNTNMLAWGPRITLLGFKGDEQTKLLYEYLANITKME